MTAVCPGGHTSTDDDYCDVCGLPIPAVEVADPATPPPPTDVPPQAPVSTGAAP